MESKYQDSFMSISEIDDYIDDSSVCSVRSTRPKQRNSKIHAKNNVLNLSNFNGKGKGKPRKIANLRGRQKTRKMISKRFNLAQSNSIFQPVPE